MEQLGRKRPLSSRSETPSHEHSSHDEPEDNSDLQDTIDAINGQRKKRMHKSRAAKKLIESIRLKILEIAYGHVRASIVTVYAFPTELLHTQTETRAGTQARAVMSDAFLKAYDGMVAEGVNLTDVSEEVGDQEFVFVRLCV